MNPIISQAKSQIKSQLFFYKYGFGIKWPMKVNMPLNKETKPSYLF